MHRDWRERVLKLSLLLLTLTPCCRAITVATVGDSFADAIYNGIRSRPDLVKKYGIELHRWSRPIVGLTRTDYFDYTGWLNRTVELGMVDLCFVQIGSNDMQSIPVSKGQWIGYGSEKWKAVYVDRTKEAYRILKGTRCRQVVWVLQPGFELREAMACHRELINRLQGEGVRLSGGKALDIITNDKAYGPDKIHFNRTYVLELGHALFQLVETSDQIRNRQCLSCHRSMTPQEVARETDIFPLRLVQPALISQAAMVLKCRIAPANRRTSRKVNRHSPRGRPAHERSTLGV
jgi:hypothetical protein